MAARQPEKLTSSKSMRKFASIFIAALVLVMGAAGLSAYETNKKEMHDLAVIGQGEPVIVQIHDPNCPTCRRLKNVVTNTLGSASPVLFRLASIATAEGKALQTKYAVPHVTLLYFDSAGKHVHTTTGMQTKAQITSAVNRYLPHS